MNRVFPAIQRFLESRGTIGDRKLLHGVVATVQRDVSELQRSDVTESQRHSLVFLERLCLHGGTALRTYSHFINCEEFCSYFQSIARGLLEKKNTRLFEFALALISILTITGGEFEERAFLECYQTRTSFQDKVVKSLVWPIMNLPDEEITAYEVNKRSKILRLFVRTGRQADETGEIESDDDILAIANVILENLTRQNIGVGVRLIKTILIDIGGDCDLILRTIWRIANVAEYSIGGEFDELMNLVFDREVAGQVSEEIVSILKRETRLSETVQKALFRALSTTRKKMDENPSGEELHRALLRYEN